MKMAFEEKKEVPMKKRKHTLKHKTSKLLEKVESEYLPDKKLKRSDTKESLDEKKNPKKQEDKVDLMLKQEQAVNRIEAIKQQIKKIALREKLKLALYVIVVLLFLNSCLISCYYIGQKTFTDDATTLQTLSTFYHRENCVDNMLLYTLEQYLQNHTVSINF